MLEPWVKGGDKSKRNFLLVAACLILCFVRYFAKDFLAFCKGHLVCLGLEKAFRVFSIFSLSVFLF